MMLRGWKQLAQYAGVHVQTIREWHYYKLRIPFLKSAPGKGGKITIGEDIFRMYLHKLFTIGIMGRGSPHKGWGKK